MVTVNWKSSGSSYLSMDGILNEAAAVGVLPPAALLTPQEQHPPAEGCWFGVLVVSSLCHRLPGSPSFKPSPSRV